MRPQNRRYTSPNKHFEYVNPQVSSYERVHTLAKHVVSLKSKAGHPNVDRRYVLNLGMKLYEPSAVTAETGIDKSMCKQVNTLANRSAFVAAVVSAIVEIGTQSYKQTHIFLETPKPYSS